MHRPGEYSSFVWNILEYLALFGIVLMHEFGHALACRQVGGQAEQIILWPLGGVAFVAPPQRAGAMLWSIAAGPLVNVVLAPIFTLAVLVGPALGWNTSFPDSYKCLSTICSINWGLLIFNLLPIFPLDGGQILRSVLWFFLGRARSLLVASLIGFPCVGLLLLLAIFVVRDLLFGAICVFILLNCWRGLTHARLLQKMARIPRRGGLACPDCGAEPILGSAWRCGQCGHGFDIFETPAVCPHCGAYYPAARCLDCGGEHPLGQWGSPSFPPPPPPHL